MRTLSRAPFSRQDFVRETIEQPPGSDLCCDWCGCEGFRLFVYGFESDSGRLNMANGCFCSVACFRTYHDIENGGAA